MMSYSCTCQVPDLLHVLAMGKKIVMLCSFTHLVLVQTTGLLSCHPEAAAAVRIGPDVEASLSLSVAAAAIRVCSDVAASITSVLTLPMHLCGYVVVSVRAPMSAPAMAPTMISTMAPTMAEGATFTHAPIMSHTSKESSGDTSGFMTRVHLRVWR